MVRSEPDTAGVDRRQALQWFGALGLPGVLGPSQAQSPVRRKPLWPTEEVELVVPYPAGGATAVLAKLVAKAITKQTGMLMRLEYRGGGAGKQGGAYAANAQADGHHLLMGDTSLCISRALLPDRDFDVFNDLQSLALVAVIPQVVVVNSQRLRVRHTGELLAELARKPARYRMASSGPGSLSYIGAHMLAQQSNARFNFVNYRGAGPALQDLLVGNVDVMIDSLASTLPHIQSGRLKAMFVSGSQRMPVLPELPCAAEVGLPGFQLYGWYGLFAPENTPAPISAEIVRAMRQVGQDPELLQAYKAMGIDWGARYGDDFESFVHDETRLWAQRIKAMGLVTPAVQAE